MKNYRKFAPSILLLFVISLTTSAQDTTAPIIPGGATKAISIAENSPTSTVVYNVEATDNGAADVGIRYNLGGSDVRSFVMNTLTGEITLSQAANYEAKSSYSFIVTATDAANNTSSQNVTLTVIDVNEPPILVAANTVSVAENTTAVGTYTATDPEGRTLSYALTGADDSLFTITSAGVLAFRSAPDYETPLDAGTDNIYNISLEITDVLGSTNIAPSATISSTVIFWYGNSPTGSIAAITDGDKSTSGALNYAVHPTSADGKTITFNFSKAYNDGRFKFFNRGVSDRILKSTVDFNYNGVNQERKTFSSSSNVITITPSSTVVFNEIVLTFSGNDQNFREIEIFAKELALTIRHSLAVTVTDVDDTAPVIPGGATKALTILENSPTSTVVYNVEATDNGAADVGIRYNLGGSDVRSFVMNTITGEITLNQAANYEAKSSYSFIVTATDVANNRSSQNVTLTVIDVNEAPILVAPKTKSVAENTTAVGTYTATDPEGRTLSYTLKGADASFFTLTSAGVLAFASAPDYETPLDAGADNIYDISLEITDDVVLTNIAPSSTISTTVTSWYGNSATNSIRAITDGVKSTSGALNYAVHPSLAHGKTITFDFTKKYSQGSFLLYSPVGLGIDITNRILKSTVAFNLKGTTQYTETITTAADLITISPLSTVEFDQVVLTFIENAQSFREIEIFAKEPGYITTHPLTVKVTDVVGDIAPIIPGGATKGVTIADNTPISTVVYNVGATNNGGLADVGITYRLSGTDAAAFNISATGEITLKQAADFDTKASYSFIVGASNTKGNTSYQKVTVAAFLDIPVGQSNIAFRTGTWNRVPYDDPILRPTDILSASFGLTYITPAEAAINHTKTRTDASGLFEYDTTVILGNIKKKYILYFEDGSFNKHIQIEFRLNAGVLEFRAINPKYIVKDSVDFSVVNPVNTYNNTSFSVSNYSLDLITLRFERVVLPVIPGGATKAVAIIENRAINTVVYNVEATDNGGAADAGITYRLSGTDAAAFNITTAGEITLKQAADFETKSSYSLVVMASNTLKYASTQTVTVTVTNIGIETAPIIPGGATKALTILENSPISTVVYNVEAAYSGGIVDVAITYSLSGSDASFFTINPATGEITLNQAANYEVKSSYDFVVTATHVSSTQSVTLTVLDVNEPPVLAAPNTVSVAENTTAVGTYTATDPEGRTLSYALKGADAPFFTLTSTGVLAFASAPDYEKPLDAGADNIYNISLEITDVLGPIITNIAPLATISTTVTDWFAGNGDVNIRAITDGVKSTVRSLDKTVIPRDAIGKTITFDFTKKYSEGAFLLYNATFPPYNIRSLGSTVAFNLGGITQYIEKITTHTDLITISPPSTVEFDQIVLTIVALDIYFREIEILARESGSTTRHTLAVTVTDVPGDIAPIIPGGATKGVLIAENLPISTVVYNVAATDNGGAADAGITYRLSGIDAAAFNITTAGEITLKQAADFETQTSYSFIVGASNATGNTSNQRLTLTVTDVDEIAPIIPGGATKGVLIAENLPISTVVYNVEATDNGGAADIGIRYSLSGSEANSFAINTTTGSITLKQVANYKAKSSYAFTVTATDAVGNASTQSVTGTVIDYNDPPVLVAANTVSVTENTTAVGTYKATDPEGKTLSYALRGADAPFFTVTSAGVLAFASAPDYEAPLDAGANNIYNISLEISDDVVPNIAPLATISTTVIHWYDSGDATANIAAITDGVKSTVGVLDFAVSPRVADGKTITFDFTKKYIEGAFLFYNRATLSQDEILGSTVAFNLGGSTQYTERITTWSDLITISPPSTVEFDQVVLTFSGRDQGFREIEILAKELGSIARHSLAVTVTDVLGDIAPIIPGGATKGVLIAENLPISTVVYNVAATDNGGAADAGITYRLSGIDAAAFNITTAGEITLKQAADYGTKTSYSFIVGASNTEGNTSYQTVTLTVTDTTAPIIPGGATKGVLIAENSPISTVVYNVEATDNVAAVADIGIRYSLSGSEASLFAINTITGSITLKQAANYEVKSIYGFVVTATDAASNASTQSVTLRVLDVNEPPVLAATNTKSVAENTIAVGTYTATDPEGRTLSYALRGTDAPFFTLTSAGVLAFASVPDYETPLDDGADNTYNISLEITDDVVPTNIAPLGIISTTVPYWNLSSQTVNIAEITNGVKARPDDISPRYAAGKTLTFDFTKKYSEGSFLYYNNTNFLNFNTLIVGSTVSFNLGGSTQHIETIITSTGLIRITPPSTVEFDQVVLTFSGYDQSFFEIEIFAKEVSAIIRHPLAVTVTDLVNENVPIIPGGATKALSILENTPISTVLYNVEATNKGGAADAGITYRLSGTDAAAFNITTAGEITLIQAADYETKTSYSFIVEASNTLKDTSTQSVTLTVLDVNEAPVLAAPNTVSVAENTTAVGTYTATDPEGRTLSYALKGADAPFFTLTSTGVLAFGSAPDYETPLDAGANNIYNISLEITDDVVPPNIAPLATISTTVTSWENGSPTGSIAAITDGVKTTSAPLNYAVHPLNAVGRTITFDFTKKYSQGSFLLYSPVGLGRAITDRILNSTVAFNLGGSTQYTETITTAADLTTISPLSTVEFDQIVLTFAGQNQSFREIEILARESGFTTRHTLAVTVTDAVGDIAPIIPGGATKGVLIAENLPISTVVYNVAATDNGGAADAGITYRLSGIDAAAFNITTAGEITLKQAADFETQTSYSFIVGASNATGNTSNQRLTLTVTDVDEIAPIIPGGATKGVLIVENLPISTVVYNVEATDNGGAADIGIRYSLSGSEANSFAINTTTGSITLKQVANYKAKSSYAFTVTATDAVGNASTQSVTGTVIDYNDPPVLVAANTVSVTENTTAVGTYKATDPEGKTLSYALRGADAPFFTVTSAGVLAFASAPDYEAPLDAGANNIYNISLEISDDVVPNIAPLATISTTVTRWSGSDDATVHIKRITDGVIKARDFFDESTSFYPLSTAGKTLTFDFTKKYSEGAFLLYNARDLNRVLLLGSTVSFNLGGSTQHIETITTYTDLITISPPSTVEFDQIVLTFADVQYLYFHEIEILARELGSIARHSLAVTVTDVLGDIAPIIPGGATKTISITESTPISTVLYNVAATDNGGAADVGIRYSLFGTDAAAFNITTAGEITLKQAADFDTKASYSFIVGASNTAGNTSNQRVIVTVADATAPIIPGGATKALTIIENTPISTVVYNVEATDNGGGADIGIRYSLSGSDASSFAINTITGSITLSQAANYEVKSSYGFTVTATDAASNASTQNVTLTVLDVNEPPVLAAVNTVSVAENTLAVGTYKAIDPEGRTLSYALKGVDAHFFTLTSTGVLAFGSAPDYEKPLDDGADNTYNISLEITEDEVVTNIAPLAIISTTIGIGTNANAVINRLIDGKTSPEFGTGYADGKTLTFDFTNKYSEGAFLFYNNTSPTFKPAIVGSTVAFNLGGSTQHIEAITTSTDLIRISPPSTVEFDQVVVTFFDHGLFVKEIEILGKRVSAIIRHPLAVTVTDAVGDIAPIIPGGATKGVTIAENTPISTVLYNVEATNNSGAADAGITYRLSGTDAAAFNITTAGEITLKQASDYETKTSYSFIVGASNALKYTSNQRVTLTVTDVVDEIAPVISLTTTAVNHILGEVYLDSGVTASDDVDGDLTANIVRGGGTINVTIAGVYTVTYDVSDATGKAAIQKTRTVTVASFFDITVGQSNTAFVTGAWNRVPYDHPRLRPTDILSASFGPTYITPTEAATNHTKTRTDASGLFEYDTTVILGNIKKKYILYFEDGVYNKNIQIEFRLHLGVLEFRAINPKYIIKSVVDFSVGDPVTTYNNILFSAGSYDLDLITLRFGETVAPVISGGGSITVNVVENATIATVLYDVQATDNGGGVDVGITYSLSGTDAAAFNISTTGEITLKQAANYEIKSSYSFVVTATDIFGNASTQTVTVRVTDVDEVTLWTGVGRVQDPTDAANWSNGTPNSTSIINIGATDQITLNTAITAETVNIVSGASLIAQQGITGTVNYTRNLATTNWYLISSPVKGQGIDAFAGRTSLSSGTGNNRGLASYNNAIRKWSYYQSGTLNSGVFEPGFGRSIKLSAPGDITFTGTFNSADASIPMTTNFDRLNLIGNPYISYISTSEVLTANNALLAERTIWMWNQAGNGYQQYNLLTAKEIAPAQGFFVSAKSSGNFSITEAMQSHTVDTFQKTGIQTKVELSVSNGASSRKADIFYIASATTGLDNGYDSSLFPGSSRSFELYTHAVANGNGEKLGIQALPNSNYETTIVPLGVKAVSGSSLSFSAKSINLPAGIATYLEDRDLNTFTEITITDYQVMLSSDLEGVGRFYLHTRSNALSFQNYKLENVSVYVADKRTLQVEGIHGGEAKLGVYNILGKQLLNSSFTGTGNNSIGLPNLPTGTYLVKIQSEAGVLNKKIIIIE